MRIGILSDIHGNLTALEAVLADLDRRGVDARYCLGDIAYRGPQPAECIDRVRALGIPSIAGNTEGWLGETPVDIAQDPRHGAVVSWCLAQLGPDRRAWAAGLPAQMQVEVGRHRLLLVHGSPRSDNEFVWPWLPVADLQPILAGVEADLVLLGHHHLPMIRTTGGPTLVGAGSVGLPFDGDPRAAYALIESSGDDLSVSIVRVPYDVDQAMATARARQLPEGDTWCRIVASGQRA